MDEYNIAIRDVMKLLKEDQQFLQQEFEAHAKKREQYTAEGRKASWYYRDTRLNAEINYLTVLRARIEGMLKSPDTILPDEPLKLEIERHE